MTEIDITITETTDDGTEVATESKAYVVNSREELETLLNTATAPKAKRPKITTICAAQEEFTATINAGYARWEHRKRPGHSLNMMGHYGRIYGGARKKLAAHLRRFGVKEAQIPVLIQDAVDVAELQRLATEDE